MCLSLCMWLVLDPLEVVRLPSNWLVKLLPEYLNYFQYVYDVLWLR